ncbi:MAG: lysophospholipid acyltransferase family protein [Gemmatimonadota bacterium]
MIRDVVWACIVCGVEGGLTETGKCRACGARYRRGRGASIVVRQAEAEAEAVYSIAEINRLLPEPGTSGSAHATVRDSIGDRPYYAHGRFLGRIERMGKPRAGTLTLSDGRLRFNADTGPGFDIPLLAITAIQPSSHALQIKERGKPVLSLKFTDSSPKLWEERLQGAIRAEYERTGRGDVVEFQPWICVKRVVATDSGSFRARRLIEGARGLRPPRPWLYRLCSWIARTAWSRFGGGVDVRGLEHIPQSGPFLVIANHESFIETMLVPAVIKRPCQAMAKSTQFNVPFFGWLMARVFAFPVRRFEIDPQTIRYVLRRFGEGYGVVIYPEGERTWDGELQPARLGVVRLALKTGVPIIPAHIEGAFEAWPRWSKKPQRKGIRIRFGAPLKLPRTRTRAEREASLNDALGIIRKALRG